MQIRGLMTSSTQLDFKTCAKIELSWAIATETNETWQPCSSTGDTLTVTIKLCYHGNLLFSSPHQSVFNIIVIFSSEKIKQGQDIYQTHLYVCQIMLMEGQNWPEKLLASGVLEPSMMPWSQNC